MIKIGEVKGEEGFFKLVYAKNYCGTFLFKLKFDEDNQDCEFTGIEVYCNTDNMTIEIWADIPDKREYNFNVTTRKIQQL